MFKIDYTEKEFEELKGLLYDSRKFLVTRDYETFLRCLTVEGYFEDCGETHMCYAFPQDIISGLYKCRTCHSLNGSDNNYIVSHRAEELGIKQLLEDIKPHKCKYCGETKKLSEMNMHEHTTKAGNKVKIYLCKTECSDSYFNKKTKKETEIKKKQEEVYNNDESNKRPIRKASLGEKLTQQWAWQNYINIIPEFIFHDKNYELINHLRFDFAVFLNERIVCLIEYDGKQHEEECEDFGGKETLEKIKYNDEYKNNFCKDKEYKLIRIKDIEDLKTNYWKIRMILDKEVLPLINDIKLGC